MRSALSCASALPADCKVEFINHGAAARRCQSPTTIRRCARRARRCTRNGARKAVAVGSGGSIPIVGDFKSVLGMDTLLVGFALDDDRMHSPNEKYDLTSFHKGTRSWARILAALAGSSVILRRRHGADGEDGSNVPRSPFEAGCKRGLHLRVRARNLIPPLRRALGQERVEALAKILAHVAHQNQVVGLPPRRAAAEGGASPPWWRAA